MGAIKKELSLITVNGFDAHFIEAVGVVLFPTNFILNSIVPVKMAVRQFLGQIVSVRFKGRPYYSSLG
jgi:hypothetical protein